MIKYEWWGAIDGIIRPADENQLKKQLFTILLKILKNLQEKNNEN